MSSTSTRRTLFNGRLVHVQNAAQPPGNVALVPDGLRGIGLPLLQSPIPEGQRRSVTGVHLNPDSKRYYPYNAMAANVLGFVDIDSLSASRRRGRRTGWNRN